MALLPRDTSVLLMAAGVGGAGKIGAETDGADVEKPGCLLQEKTPEGPMDVAIPA
jgi:hypothetical protein